MKKISIVGFGRFGHTLYNLIKDDFEITIFDKKKIAEDFRKNTTVAKSLTQVYQNTVIFFAVPISEFENVISQHKKYFNDNHLLIDVLSVKVHPAKVFKKHLKGKTQVLLTHPMFGPDSSKNGFDNLTLVMDKFLADDKNHKFWKEYFENKKLNIIKMSARDHDRLAANSQGVAHFIGRLLEAYNFKKTPIDSVSARKLLDIKEQICNDTWQLFTDLQHFNFYTKHMQIRLGRAYDNIYNRLLPKQTNTRFLTFGIQGGKGSFNEEAIQYYLKKEGIKNSKVKYLHTSKKVLDELYKGNIDRGQFAIYNSVGGIVGESIDAMADYKFKIIEQFEIKISHALMIRQDVKFSDITTIMTHPQVLAQCKSTLAKKYPNLKQISGEKELIDHSKVAKYLSQKKLPTNIATMGSKILAQIYNLQIIEDNLQDAKENYTSFLQVSRP